MSRWCDSLSSLSRQKTLPKNLQKLQAAGLDQLRDLLWILPLRNQAIPSVAPFHQAQESKLFLGEATVIDCRMAPAFGRKGKGGMRLFNVTLIAKDTLSDQHITLKWFNAYPNLQKQISDLGEFRFLATISFYQGSLQGINPKLNPKLAQQNLIEYPTVNSVSGKFIEKYIKAIPEELWQQELDPERVALYQKLNIADPIEAFKVIHGIAPGDNVSYQRAEQKLIYVEFLEKQLRILARRRRNDQLKAQIIPALNSIESLIALLPFQLTPDQLKVLEEIKGDLVKGTPMMRIVQGDVGCGKTIVSLLAAKIVLEAQFQVALMCPTESLAQQHYREFTRYLKDEALYLLVGSTPLKEKKQIYAKISTSLPCLVIGTHALIQKSVQFSGLQLVIIDEQHKFGVNQRLNLFAKGHNPHSLIMSATPIPRTLQLAQYGDLDISTIKTMPANRKGHKTRIVRQENFEKFLSFLKTRLSLGEQAYVVTPAIEESQLDINYVEKILQSFKQYYPEFRVAEIHGKMDGQSKNDILLEFRQGRIHILVSTSVIEVGIDNPNASVMAVFNPERFGLSSLHQLRGRVGRGDRPGFFFLIAQPPISNEAIKRLEILEQSCDGFAIAEADLANRGEGDLFGKNQSGDKDTVRIAHPFFHMDVFQKVIADVKALESEHPKLLAQVIDKMIADQNISSTI